MQIKSKTLTEKTSGFCDIVDITGKIQEQIDNEKIQRGLVTIFVSGSTAALTTIENEPGLIEDLKEFVEKLIPSCRKYQHDDRSGEDIGCFYLCCSLSCHSWAIPREFGS